MPAAPRRAPRGVGYGLNLDETPAGEGPPATSTALGGSSRGSSGARARGAGTVPPQPRTRTVSRGRAADRSNPPSGDSGMAAAGPADGGGPSRAGRRSVRRRPATVRPVAWWRATIAWLVACVAAVWEWGQRLTRTVSAGWSSRASGSYDGLVSVLLRVERAQPAPPDLSHIAAPSARDEQEEEALQALRSHRAPRTNEAVAATCRSIRALLAANVGRATQAAASGDAWDRVLEAWVVARVDPERSPWKVPAGWRSGGYDAAATEKAAASWRAAMVRLRYAKEDSWPRSRSMGRGLGGVDAEGNHGKPPLFAWEVLRGLRLRPPASTWDRGAAALLTVGMLSASRRGNARRIILGNVTKLSDDSVSLRFTERPKPARDRQLVADGKHDRPLRLRHWAVRRYLLPWVEYLKGEGLHGTALLFPSMVRVGPRIVRTDVGRLVGDLWCEPLREWSDRALVAAIGRFVESPANRTFQSLRVGNNIELRRSRDVSDVTRRLLHGRSVKDLIGSEIAYNEVLAEDLAGATARIGSLRIVRQPDGLLSCTATSASAGETDDWVPIAGAVAFEALDQVDSSESESDPDDTRVQYNCFRCGVVVRKSHHGYLCDHAGCASGTCVRCHPGGDASTLWCPRHDPRVASAR